MWIPILAYPLSINQESTIRGRTLPLYGGIKSGVEMIMVGHLAVPTLCKGKTPPHPSHGKS